MWHSCGKFELDALFSKSEPHVFRLYEQFVELVQSFGPVTVIPQKTRVAVQARVRFTGCVPRRSHLECSFWFTEKKRSPRFHRIEQYAPNAYGHYVRVRDQEDFDAEFEDWIREAYAVGRQEHLRKGPP